MNHRYLHTHLLLRWITALILLVSSGMVIADTEAEGLYKTGLSYYESGHYETAIKELEKASRLEPNNAKYHHILAKSYGYEAENAGWFRAMKLAKKTLEHLEVAAKLDKNNVEILDDLMDYYREAPGFLGGDIKKANEIEARIEKLNHANDQISMTPVTIY